MAEHSAIAWTRSTFNSWIGCTKVGPGCDHCYAEALDKRHKWGGAVHWGAGVPRFRTSEKNWKHPIEWNKLAALEQRSGILTLGSDWKGRIGFWPVFCASLADVFDNEVPVEWRDDLFHLIEATPNLSWLLVTKRVGNVREMVRTWWENQFPSNVRLLITVCNQEEADRDIPKLLALPCKNGVSYEPALGPVDWTRLPIKRGEDEVLLVESGRQAYAKIKDPHINALAGYNDNGRDTHIEWIIVGGESTQGSGKARPFDLAWARSTIAQCKAAGVACFVKQLGSNVLARNDAHGCDVYAPRFRDRAGADPSEWPEDLRVREFPA